MVTFQILCPQKDKQLVNDFYMTHARSARVENQDFVLGIYSSQILTGLVRISSEENIYVLRSMQIHRDFQRQKLGQKLLEKLNHYLYEKNFFPLYCIPYAHLTSFYGLIQFEKIHENTAPLFLQKRIEEYRLKDTQSSFCVMQKTKTE